MLSTDELKEYIQETVSAKIPNADYKIIRFEVFDKWSIPEYIYIFSDGKKYHMLETERGQVRYDNTTKELDEVLFFVVDLLACWIGQDYAKGQKEAFGRLYQEKRMEICSLFGKDFCEREQRKVEERRKRASLACSKPI